MVVFDPGVPCKDWIRTGTAAAAHSCIGNHCDVRRPDSLMGSATKRFSRCRLGYHNFWMAPIRLTIPFATGLWIYRVRDRLPRMKLGFLTLTVALLAAFMMPVFPKLGSFSYNSLYAALCVLLVFPSILVAGAVQIPPPQPIRPLANPE
jgi:hypothetical protein